METLEQEAQWYTCTATTVSTYQWCGNTNATTTICNYWQPSTGGQSYYSGMSQLYTQAINQLGNGSLRQYVINRHNVEVAEVAEAALAEVERTRYARQREAAAKARTLLLEELDDQQRASLEAAKHFDVIGQTGRTFRVHVDRGMAGNVFRLDAQGRVVARYCGHPDPDEFPVDDGILTQVLMIRFCEAEFERLANITPMSQDTAAMVERITRPAPEDIPLRFDRIEISADVGERFLQISPAAVAEEQQFARAA